MKVSYDTDMAPDGQRSFHTTLQIITKQGCKPLLVKVDPGADANIVSTKPGIDLYFPNIFTAMVLWEAHSLRKSKATWSPHDGTTHRFIGFFTVDVQYKTKPDVIPITFYIFKDPTRPFIPPFRLCIHSSRYSQIQSS